MSKRRKIQGGWGNAVLFGHVESRNLRNVFKDLGRARVGDIVQAFSGDVAFSYRIVEKRVVPRTDVSVLQPTSVPSLTLITCTGRWLPRERDYAERLVLRGELVAAVVPRDGGPDLRGDGLIER